ncbi:13277_t:CDS:2 [Rhizophagus irregularis]|nr:13277_t:CDS:2 [Rhizophagus irregularis]
MSTSPSTSPARKNSYEQDDDLSFLEKFRYINGRRFHNEESTMLEDNGSITNIQYEEKFTPIGKWCGQTGEIMLSNFMSAFNTYKLFLAPFMNITIEQFDILLNEMEKEFNDHQSYVHTYRVYGKKSFEICDI